MMAVFRLTIFLLPALLLNGCGRNSPEKMEAARVRSILIGSRAYATDHEGEYPSSLTDLHPKYIALISSFYSPPREKRRESAEPFHYRSGLKVNSKVDEPLVISPRSVKGKVCVGYRGGFMRKVDVTKAQKLLNETGWSQSAPPLTSTASVK